MRRSRRTTLHDVAREAGVSRTTASYVLNGRAEQMRISADADERVREVAERLGYRPNRNAASLRTQRTATIGLITDFVAGGMFSSRLIVGASSGARDHEHVLLIGETEGDVAVEQALVQEMVDRQVDGIVYATRAASRVRLPDAVRGLPVVTLNCFDPDTDVPSVMPDDRGGGWTAADILARAGVRDVVVVGEEPSDEVVAGYLRVEGVAHRLSRDGEAVRDRVVCDWSVESAFAAVDDWLASGQRAEGLVCLNDRVAMGTYQALAEHGLRVPDDVSVVSFDGTDVARWLRPTLTSVGIPFFEMGEIAISMLLAPERAKPRILEMPVLPGGSVRTRVPA